MHLPFPPASGPRDRPYPSIEEIECSSIRGPIPPSAAS